MASTKNGTDTAPGIGTLRARQKSIQTRVPWRTYMAVGLVTLLTVAAMGHSLSIGSRVIETYAPLVDAAMEIKLEAALSHLRYEEIIAGYPDKDITTARHHLDQSEWYARAMLEGGQNSEGTFVPLEDPGLRHEIEDVLRKIGEFRAIAEERFAAMQDAGADARIDQDVDALFADFLAQADRVETRLQLLISIEKQLFYAVEIGLIVVCAGVAAVVTIVLVRHDRERTRTLLDLLESEGKYRRLVENLPQRIFQKDANSVYVSCNENYARDLGIAAHEIEGKTDFDFYPQALAEKYRADDLRLMESGQAEDIEESYIKNGEEFVVQTVKAPLTDDAGAISGILGIFWDITARKQAEEALRKSEAAYRTLIEQAADAILVAGPDGRFQQVNSRACELFGYSTEEFVGLHVSAIVTPEEAPKSAEALRRIAAGERVAVERQYRRKDGSVFPGDLSACQTIDGLILGIVRDITDRKESEEALRSALARNRSILQTAMDGYWRVDMQNNLLEVNEAYCQMSGYSESELLAMKINDLEAIESPDETAAHMQKFKLLGEDRFVSQHRHKSGLNFDVEISVQYKPEDGGYIVVFLRDITEQKQAEAQHVELEAQLRQSQKMEAIGQLAGGVAHDFNNILTAILGNVDLGMDGVRHSLGSDHSVFQSMEQIEKAAERASTLTRQLLTFSRRDIAQPEILNLNSILTNLDKMLKRLITENISLETIVEPELGSVRADAGQVEQVIVNLVVNAVHAMPDGGRLTLETQNVTLEEDYTNCHVEAQPGPHVMLAVSDTGHGMDAATLERIFEPFFTTKPVDKGTGLGLATVHGIVKQSGGHIMVYSEPGHGTTFKVYLPTAVGASAAPMPNSLPVATPRGHETVLLCEDDGPVCELIAHSLRTGGYTVITAGCGQEGLDAAQAHVGPLDLLITDVIMPDMNGRTLSERLQAVRPGLPALFISGYTSNVIAHHGVLDEGVEFLEKPFTRPRLLAKVHEVLTKARTDG